MDEAKTMADVGSVPQPMGPRIRIARKNAGMSPEQLAQRLGVGLESVLAWEADERTPRAGRLLAMAGLLDTSLPWLLEGREDDHRHSQRPFSRDDLRRQLNGLHDTLSDAQQQLNDISSHLDGLE
jgi:transcriptional regulator with XRE-family HTH domain